jgi:acyl-coenzyme A thioesterase PaaI-like protein
MPAASRVLSVEFKVNLLSPARGERFRAEGRVIKAGRTITVCEGKLFSMQGEEESLCAIMQATMICIRE